LVAAASEVTTLWSFANMLIIIIIIIVNIYLYMAAVGWIKQ